MSKANLSTRFILAVILLPYWGLASEGPEKNDPNLYFLATQNQVKLLNQKLEYRVLNENTMQVGNLAISTDNLKLHQQDQSTVILEGPTQFMVGGTLILKDPHGRALWSEVIKDLSSLEPVTPSPESTGPLRTNSSRFPIRSFDSLIESLTQASFFSFCIFTETKTNRIQVCTPNYSIQQTGNQWQLTSLESSTKENLVVVNGTEVNEHGIIQFDQNIKTVSMAAKLASGLSVEVKTDYIELSLLDIFFDEPQAIIHLKLREKSKGKKVYPWNTQVSLKNPYLYIEAFGQVPLRQEVAVNKDDLPLPSHRPTLLTTIDKTYQSSLRLLIQNQPGLKIKARTKGDVTSQSDAGLQWTLNNLKYGLNKPHLLSIQNQQKNFIGAFEVERARSVAVSLDLGVNSVNSTHKIGSQTTSSSDSGTLLQLSAQKYFDSFFGSYSSFNHLRWSTSFSHAEKSYSQTKAKASASDLSLGYRMTSNFHHSESSSTLRVGLLNQTTTVGNLSSNSLWLGVKLAYDGPVSMFKTFFGTSFDTQVSAYALCLSQDCKNTSLYDFYWQSRFDFRTRYFWSWKLLFEQSSSQQENSSSSSSQMGLQIGLGLQI